MNYRSISSCGGLVYKKKVWRWFRLSKWRLW